MKAEEIAQRIEAIRQDEERGASQLAREAVQLLAEIAADLALPDAAFAGLLEDTTRKLARARPSMAPLMNGVGAVLAAWIEAGGDREVETAREAAAQAARRWGERQVASLSFLADHTAEVVSGTVITLSYSSTVLQVLEECRRRGVIRGVIVAESRPLFEGRRTAAALASHGIPTTLITDAEMGLFAAEANAGLVGADTIQPNGALINKAGTLLLALAARRCRVPFYALAESSKIAPNGRRRHPTALLEKKAPEEVMPEPIPGVTACNVYFDVTPARYVTGYLTERGLLNRKDVVALSREAPGALLIEAGEPAPG